MKAKNPLNEKGSYYIIIMLVMALIFPLILYITAGFQQQSFMTKRIKQNINRALLAASLQMTSYHDEEEDIEVPPKTRIIIDEERARDAFEAVLNDNMKNIGISPSRYSYDLIIDNGIDEPFPHDVYIRGDILDQYQSATEDPTTPVIRAKSPTIIAFVKVDTGGMFSINKIQTFRISSSDIIKPER